MAKILVSKICGLCNGSSFAINRTRELANEKNNVVLFKELLHNKNVIKELEKLGVKTKEKLDDIMQGEFVIIRAHGEPKKTFEYLTKNNIQFQNLTCANVKAINFLVNKKESEGYKIILIGKHGFDGKPIHPEVEGTSGWCTNPIIIEDESEINDIDMSFPKYFLAVQTTFNKDKAEKFIDIINKKMQNANKIFEFKNTVCDAQKNINLASIDVAKQVDIMIVVGGKNSSNTKELYNKMKEITKSYHIENEEDLNSLITQGLLPNDKVYGLTGGASTMHEDIEHIKKLIEKI